MREIKFRGWSGYGRWDYGFGVEVVELTEEMQNGLGVECIPYLYTERGKMTVKPKSVGQYTGLKDKNGREVYEGDLFFWNGRMRRIVYREDKSAFMGETVEGYPTYFYLVEAFQRIEIIGNIYENKELLEGLE